MEKEKKQNWIMNTAVALVGVGVLTASGRDLPKKMSDAPTNTKIVQRGKVVNSFKDYMNMAYESGKRGDSASEVRDYKKALRIANGNRIFISQNEVKDAAEGLSAVEKKSAGRGSNENNTAKGKVANKGVVAIYFNMVVIGAALGVLFSRVFGVKRRVYDLFNTNKQA